MFVVEKLGATNIQLARDCHYKHFDVFSYRLCIFLIDRDHFMYIT